jgi:hypothetical protein
MQFLKTKRCKSLSLSIFHATNLEIVIVIKRINIRLYFGAGSMLVYIMSLKSITYFSKNYYRLVCVELHVPHAMFHTDII